MPLTEGAPVSWHTFSQFATAFVANDLTDDKTKKTSIETLKKYGLEQALAPLKGTGVAYFFNAETKALINQVNISKSDEELAEVLKATKNAVTGSQTIKGVIR